MHGEIMAGMLAMSLTPGVASAPGWEVGAGIKVTGLLSSASEGVSSGDSLLSPSTRITLGRTGVGVRRGEGGGEGESELRLSKSEAMCMCMWGGGYMCVGGGMHVAPKG